MAPSSNQVAVPEEKSRCSKCRHFNHATKHCQDVHPAAVNTREPLKCYSGGEPGVVWRERHFLTVGHLQVSQAIACTPNSRNAISHLKKHAHLTGYRTFERSVGQGIKAAREHCRLQDTYWVSGPVWSCLKPRTMQLFWKLISWMTWPL